MFPNLGPVTTPARGTERVMDFIMDPLALNIPNLTVPPQLVDRNTGRLIGFAQTGGGAGRGYDALIGRNYMAYGGGLGTYQVAFSPAFTCPQGFASPVNPVHVFGIQFRTETLTLPAAGQDQGFFFKTTANGNITAVYSNSVAYGIIPVDERAFGFNRDVTGVFNFVSIVGGGGRVVTPLVWPVADARFPVNVEFRFFEATAEKPSLTFELWLNTTRVIQSAMTIGNVFGLPTDLNGGGGRTAWLQCWVANGGAVGCAATNFYYRNGPTAAGTI